MTAPPAPDPGRVYTPAEAAALVGVHIRTLANWHRAGKFSEGTVTVTEGGKRRYRGDGLRPFLNGGQR